MTLLCYFKSFLFSLFRAGIDWRGYPPAFDHVGLRVLLRDLDQSFGGRYAIRMWQIIDRNWTQYCSDEARFDNSKNETPSRSTADDLQTGWTLNLIDAIYGSVGSSQSRPELKTRISVQFRCTVGVMSVGGPLDSFYIAWLVTIRDKITKYFHSRLTGWIRSTILAFIDRPPAKRRGIYTCNFGRVCLSVCQTITFESLDIGSLFSHIP